MKFSPYSHSKITSFLSCPMRFKLTYIDKVKQERKPAYLQRGIDVHEILAVYPQTTSDIVNRFLNSEVGKKYDKVLRGETRREVRIGLDDDFKLQKYSNKSKVNGIVDLIYIEDGVVHLVDWKTGKAPEEQDWLQLETYAIPFLKDATQVVLSYVYIDQCIENTKVVQASERPQLVAKLTAIINNIETAEEFPRCISWQCDYCQCNKACNPDLFGLENTIINLKKD